MQLWRRAECSADKDVSARTGGRRREPPTVSTWQSDNTMPPAAAVAASLRSSPGRRPRAAHPYAKGCQHKKRHRCFPPQISNVLAQYVQQKPHLFTSPFGQLLLEQQK